MDEAYGTYGTHSCQAPNTVTAHLLKDAQVSAGSYTLRIVVLNPGLRAVRDLWAVELHAPDSGSLELLGLVGNASAGNGSESGASLPAKFSDWRSTKPILELQLPGFGISTAFSGQPLPAIAFEVTTAHSAT